MRLSCSFTVFALCTGLTSFSQCVTDVVIQQAPMIDMCENALITISGTDGYTNYMWTGPQTATGQTITPNSSGQYVLTAVDATGCTSDDTINVIIHPSPLDVVLSSDGNPICQGEGSTLSLAASYVSYNWGQGNTNATYDVSGPGVYEVTFTDDKGCVGSSSITLSEINFSLTASSNSICVGGTTTLTATGGETYSWSNGDTSNFIVVNPKFTTLYTVTITNGTCVETLSQSVNPGESFDYNLEDTVYLAAGDFYYLYGPAGLWSSAWSPADQLRPSGTDDVVFTADSSQLITLTAVHPDGCEFKDSIMMIVVQLTTPNAFSPNNDGKNDFFIIPELYEYPGALIVWNRWGEIVLEKQVYENNWDGTCQTALCIGSGDLPEGTYFYQVNVEEITSTGYITLKR